MEMTANDLSGVPPYEGQQEAPSQPLALAPVWHTLVLIAFILSVSLRGVYRHPGEGSPNRLITYGVTALLEFAMVAWVAFGLRLRRISLRSLFGSVPTDIRSIALDVGIAFIFWIGSLLVLATMAIAWIGVENAVTHLHAPVHAGQPSTPDQKQKQAVNAVLQLAPSNAKEVAGWVLLCVLVGIAEELIFRGYLQRQFSAWGRGHAAVGVVFSALIFGGAHGYEGMRSMFLLSVFGSLFSLLALFRRSLRAGIFAHSFHDLIAGLTLAILHSRHVV